MTLDENPHPAFVVVCEDGAIRHGQVFTAYSDASAFANWGHCCTTSHLIKRVR